MEVLQNGLEKLVAFDLVFGERLFWYHYLRRVFQKGVEFVVERVDVEHNNPYENCDHERGGQLANVFSHVPTLVFHYYAFSEIGK